MHACVRPSAIGLDWRDRNNQLRLCGSMHLKSYLRWLAKGALSSLALAALPGAFSMACGSSGGSSSGSDSGSTASDSSDTAASDSSELDSRGPDAPEASADVSADVQLETGESSVPVTCTTIEGGGPPCAENLSGCSDGHTYSITCDASGSCQCKVDGVSNGKTTTEAVCEGTVAGWDSACGWSLG
jgi:hypothetical protein